MKKIIFIVIVLLLISAVLAVGFSLGWDYIGRLGRVATPEVKAIGNVLYWDEIEHAESYDVFNNGVFLETVSAPGYVATDINDYNSFTVVANAGKTWRKSKESHSVTVLNELSFSPSETLAINLTYGYGEYVVHSNIKYVKITGTSLESNVVIEDRDDDLFIKLENVTMMSPIGKNCISAKNVATDFSDLDYGVALIVAGENSLVGSDYLRGADSSSSSFYGSNGGNGSSAIVVPKLAIIGNGTLTLDAGDGGRGEAASSSKSAGDGGAGGSGIKCTETILAYNGILRIYVGNGGDGGSAFEPSNNSLLIDSSSNRPAGAEGAKGQAIEGELIILNGSYTES